MNQLWRPLAWLFAATIIVVTLGPVSVRPQFGHPQFERFAGFFILASSWSWPHAKRLSWVFAGTVAAAVLLEAGQLLVPGRDAGVQDALAKIAGAACGVLTVVLATRVRAARAVERIDGAGPAS